MGLKDRISRAEKRAGVAGPRPCEACGDRIVVIEYEEDGTAVYPHGEPCKACGSRPAHGGVGIIRVCPPDDDEEEAGDVSFP